MEALRLTDEDGDALEIEQGSSGGPHALLTVDEEGVDGDLACVTINLADAVKIRDWLNTFLAKHGVSPAVTAETAGPTEIDRLKADIAILQCQVASLSCGTAPRDGAYCVDMSATHAQLPLITVEKSLLRLTEMSNYDTTYIDAAHAATFYDDGFVAPPATLDANDEPADGYSPHIAQGE